MAEQRNSHAPWHETILLGMAEAGRAAIDIAQKTNTKLAVWVGGRTQTMTADEWKNYPNISLKMEVHVSH